jgi:hypothetical protein
MNRFQRTASKYAYYGYLNRFTPEILRNYQSEQHLVLGRRGAYDTLVIKMAVDHLGYEEDFNQHYKTPMQITKLSIRVAIFLFIVPIFMMFFNYDDMVRIFQPHKYRYIGEINDAEVPSRYETLYIIDRLPRF